MPIFRFWTITSVNNKGFSPNAICIDIKEIWFGIANGQISSHFYGVINLSKHQWISPNLVSALILWTSGLGLLMGKFRQFLTELSARDTPLFSFLDYNFSK